MSLREENAKRMAEYYGCTRTQAHTRSLPRYESLQYHRNRWGKNLTEEGRRISKIRKLQRCSKSAQPKCLGQKGLKMYGWSVDR